MNDVMPDRVKDLPNVRRLLLYMLNRDTYGLGVSDILLLLTKVETIHSHEWYGDIRVINDHLSEVAVRTAEWQIAHTCISSSFSARWYESSVLNYIKTYFECIGAVEYFEEVMKGDK